MNKVWYRTRQFGFSRVLRLTEKKSAERITGRDAIMRIPELCEAEGIKSVLLVTTAGFIKRGTLEPLMGALKDKEIALTVFSEVKPDPVIESVEAGVEAYRAGGCEAIIAVGGGSAMDCAKVIGARIVRPDRTIPEMRGLLKVGRRIPVMFAVPTTAGTGSEVTCAAVVTETVNGTHYKYPISDFNLIPRYAVLDAGLTAGLSPEMTAATGMDALTHAVEAYTNLFASKYVKKMATDAVTMIFANLPKAYADGSDMEARENMLLASCYAGIAFTNNFVGYVHAIAHGIGGLYGVPHGRANAVILPVVLRHFGASVYGTLSELADAVGIKGDTERDRAEAFIARIDEMRESMGIPAVIGELKESDFDELVRRALCEGNPSYPVPAIWDRDGFMSVLEELIAR